MALTETGGLTHRLTILDGDSSTVDEYGDRKEKQKVVARPWAMQRTAQADDVVANIADLKKTKQFVIRHRYSDMTQITSDMKVLDRGKIYEIDAYNNDDQYQEWDVIICHEVVTTDV